MGEWIAVREWQAQQLRQEPHPHPSAFSLERKPLWTLGKGMPKQVHMCEIGEEDDCFWVE
jgi:hypothetical protein